MSFCSLLPEGGNARSKETGLKCIARTESVGRDR
jgi:hypothetical protein